jgi:hypothetical protein
VLEAGDDGKCVVPPGAIFSNSSSGNGPIGKFCNGNGIPNFKDGTCVCNTGYVGDACVVEVCLLMLVKKDAPPLFRVRPRSIFVAAFLLSAATYASHSYYCCPPHTHPKRISALAELRTSAVERVTALRRGNAFATAGGQATIVPRLRRSAIVLAAIQMFVSSARAVTRPVAPSSAPVRKRTFPAAAAPLSRAKISAALSLPPACASPAGGVQIAPVLVRA